MILGNYQEVRKKIEKLAELNQKITYYEERVVFLTRATANQWAELRSFLKFNLALNDLARQRERYETQIYLNKLYGQVEEIFPFFASKYKN